MYPGSVPTIRDSRSFWAIILSLLILTATVVQAAAQTRPAQLSLADIIVALRSKKVPPNERNKILTDAVLERGITFALTAEIEKELSATGADKELVSAIKSKSPAIKVSAVNPSNEPVKPPEFLARQQQGDADFARGDIEAAVVEYSKAIELKPTLASAYLSRGRIYLTKGWYDNAISDFSKVIQLDPTDPAAFSNRGQAWEKKGDRGMAAADYVNAINLKPDETVARAGLERINPDTAKSQPPATDKPSDANPAPAMPPASSKVNTEGTVPAGSGGGDPSKVAKTPPPPDLIDLGPLSTANAVRLVKPTYSAIALKSNIRGKVRVGVTIDEEGNVTSAKAIDGHQLLRQSSEDAARRSKFKPAMYSGKPVKSTGVITYNYSPSGSTSEE